MADVYSFQEFTKAQASTVLACLPKSIRDTLRYYEVAALLDPFRPRPPQEGPRLKPQTYWYVVITDWKLVLVSVSTSGRRPVVLQLPLLDIADLDYEAAEAAGYLSNQQQSIHACSIYIYPRSQLPAASTQQQVKSTAAGATPAAAAAAPPPAAAATLGSNASGAEWPSGDAAQASQQQEPTAPKQSKWDFFGLVKTATASGSAAASGSATAAGSGASSTGVNWGIAPVQPAASSSAAAGATPTGSTGTASPGPAAAAAAPGAAQAAGGAKQKKRPGMLSMLVNAVTGQVQEVTQPAEVDSATFRRDLMQQQTADGFLRTIGFLNKQQQELIARRELHEQQGPWLLAQSNFDQQLQVDPTYCLHLLTVERTSCLFYQLQAAWLGAHTRHLLSKALVPGLPLWTAPPPQHCHSQGKTGTSLLAAFRNRKHAGKQQQQQSTSPAKQGHASWASPVAAPGSSPAGGTWPSGPQQPLVSPVAGTSEPAAAGGAPGVSPGLALFFGIPQSPDRPEVQSNRTPLHGTFPGDEITWPSLQGANSRHSTGSRSTAATAGGAAAAAAGGAAAVNGAGRDSRSTGPSSGRATWEQDAQFAERIKAAELELSAAASAPPGTSYSPLAAAGLSPLSAAAAGPGAAVASWATDYERMLQRQARRRSDINILEAFDQLHLGRTGQSTLQVAASAPVPGGEAPAAAGAAGVGRPKTTASKRQQMQQLQQQQQQQAAADAAGAAPRTTAASTTSSGSRSNPTSRETQDSAPAAAGAPPVSGSSSPNKRPKQHQQSRRTYMQATCALYHRNQSAEAKEAFHGLVEDLLKPCSLFDEADVLLLKQLVLELAFCPQEQLSALQQQFFSNKQVLNYVATRLTAWGTLLNMFHEGLPPIKNPSIPGMAEAWKGKQVAWSSSLLYAGRPHKLLLRLGVTRQSPITIGRPLSALQLIQERHSAALAAGAQGSSSSGADITRGHRMGVSSSFYADPLKLSPLPQLPYLFVQSGRQTMSLRQGDESSYADQVATGGRSRFSTCSSSSSSGRGINANNTGLLHSTSGSNSLWSTSSAQPKLGSTLQRYGSTLGSTTGTTGTGHTSQATEKEYEVTLVQGTTILRWERLMGRLCARLAFRKLKLLLYWLQLQLGSTEGCSARLEWLSDKPLQDPASCPNPEPITCRSATRQLLVALLTLRHPAGDDRSDALIPGGTEDLLWWAQEGKQGYVLDSVVAVVAQLQELCEQARVMGQKEAAEEVVQVVPQLPAGSLAPLLRRMLLRLICLTSGCAASRAFVTVPQQYSLVLGCQYATLLLALLSAAGTVRQELQQRYVVELQHLLKAEQVQQQIAAHLQPQDQDLASAVMGCRCQQLLLMVLTAVTCGSSSMDAAAASLSSTLQRTAKHTPVPAGLEQAGFAGDATSSTSTGTSSSSSSGQTNREFRKRAGAVATGVGCQIHPCSVSGSAGYMKVQN